MSHEESLMFLGVAQGGVGRGGPDDDVGVEFYHAEGPEV
jgi:hypothetical protein